MSSHRHASVERDCVAGSGAVGDGDVEGGTALPRGRSDNRRDFGDGGAWGERNVVFRPGLDEEEEEEEEEQGEEEEVDQFRVVGGGWGVH